MQGYLAWGSDGDARPAMLKTSRGGHGRARCTNRGWTTARCTMRQSTTRRRICWSMPMWADEHVHCRLRCAGPDCRRTAETERRHGTSRSRHTLRAKLLTMWNDEAGIFLNKDLRTGNGITGFRRLIFIPCLPARLRGTGTHDDCKTSA